MIFGMLNPEKFDRKILKIFPPYLSHVATLPWKIQKVIFNSFILTYLWLFMLSQKKTNCNPLAHPTWKCHHTNLWIAKHFHLTEGLWRSCKRWRFWSVDGLPTFCRHWSVPNFAWYTVLCWNSAHVATIKPLLQAATCPYQYTRSSCSVPQMQY